MFDLIERLRQKPEKSKKKIAFLASFFVTGLIFAVWFSVIYPDFSFKQKQKEAAKVVNETSPAEGFFENILAGFSDVKSQFKDLKTLISSFSTTTHYTSNDSTVESTSSLDSPAF